MTSRLLSHLQAEIQSFRNHVALHGLPRVILYQAAIATGATLSAFGYSMFMVPFNLAAGGIGGLGVIINHYTGWPPGVLFLLMNLPLLALGFYQLERWRFLFSCLLSIAVFSVAADLFAVMLPSVMKTYPVTEDLLLNAIYGGLFFGLGVGIVFRYGGTFGGTVIPARILHARTGYPLSQTFFYFDGGIIILAGMVFGWELALLGMLSLFISGLATDFVIEGVSQVRTITIVSARPGKLKQEILKNLGRGISQWQVTGGYSDRNFTMLFCTVSRSQVQDLKAIVAEYDREAFLVVGVAQQAVGSFNFHRHASNRKTRAAAIVPASDAGGEPSAIDRPAEDIPPISPHG